MEGWITKKLEDVVDLKRGFDLPTHSRRPGPYPVLSSGVTAGWHDEGPIKGPGLVIGRATNLGQPSWSQGDFWPLNTTLYAANFFGNEPRWVFHLFESMDLTGFDSGSVQPMLNRNYIAQLPILVPPIREQRAIAEVLGALDDKIAANSKLAETFMEYVSTEFDSAVAADSTPMHLADLCEFHNRKRIPLSAREREVRVGSVPYYGASGIFGFVDEPIFNENLVLVGEDGSVIRGDGTPVTQYIWGPAWVNNHAHVLRGTHIPTELLYFAIRGQQVASLVTGAVQPKISMGNLKRLALQLPPAPVLQQLGELAEVAMASYRSLTDENRTLAATRDTLLPQLMSGKLRVKDIEITMGEMV